MSTRCQIQVIEEHEDRNFKVTLYRHTDGRPEYITKKLYEIYRDEKIDCVLDKVMAGKVASLICSSDPAKFEPQSTHELHRDIEFYYPFILSLFFY